MRLFGKPKGKKYHSRSIEVNIYEYDDQRLTVVGCLTDNRWQEFYLATGEKREPGLLHQMVIHLLVNKTNLEIEDIHVEMPCVPRESCLETITDMKSIKGLKIAAGFTSKLKALAGRGKGCAHLVALLTSMGASAIQGYAADKLREYTNMSTMINLIENSCWTWRTEGSLINAVREKIKTEHKA